MNSGFDTFMGQFVVQHRPASRRTPSQYELSKVGFPIRKSSDQSLFAAPQGLSQRTTSFIASQRQGIHRMLLLHLITLMIDGRLSLSRDVDPYNDRPQDSAPRQRSERPVFGTLIPKTFACLMHPAHTPCGGRVVPRSKIPEPATCITSLRCQTPAIAPVFRNHHELQKSQPNTQASTPQGETTTPHATRSQPRTSKTPKKNGGARRDRTDDLKLAKLPLSQLSYGPPWQSQGVFDPLASSAGADVRPLRLSAPRGAAAIRPGGADAPKNGACA